MIASTFAATPMELMSFSNPSFIQDMVTWLVSGKIKTKEEVVVGIESMPSAMARMWTGDKLGKLVVQVAEGSGQ